MKLDKRLGEAYHKGVDSKAIKELRKSLRLTQKEFAARLKVDVITVSRWERGEQRPSKLALKQLGRLAKKVGKK